MLFLFQVFLSKLFYLFSPTSDDCAMLTEHSQSSAPNIPDPTFSYPITPFKHSLPALHFSWAPGQPALSQLVPTPVSNILDF